MDVITTRYALICLDKFKRAMETETIMVDMSIIDMWYIVYLHKSRRYYSSLRGLNEKSIIQQAAEYTQMIQHIFQEYAGCLPRLHPLETLGEVQHRILTAKLGVESAFKTSKTLEIPLESKPHTKRTRRRS